jgi:hypothetical protein
MTFVFHISINGMDALWYPFQLTSLVAAISLPLECLVGAPYGTLNETHLVEIRRFL